MAKFFLYPRLILPLLLVQIIPGIHSFLDHNPKDFSTFFSFTTKSAKNIQLAGRFTDNGEGRDKRDRTRKIETSQSTFVVRN